MVPFVTGMNNNKWSIFGAKSGKVFDKVLSHENWKGSNCLLFFSSFSAFLNPKSLIG